MRKLRLLVLGVAAAFLVCTAVGCGGKKPITSQTPNPKTEVVNAGDAVKTGETDEPELPPPASKNEEDSSTTKTENASGQKPDTDGESSDEEKTAELSGGALVGESTDAEKSAELPGGATINDPSDEEKSAEETNGNQDVSKDVIEPSKEEADAAKTNTDSESEPESKDMDKEEPQKESDKTGGEGMSTKNGYYGALHVEGTKLKDEKGATVVLRGISTHGLGWFPTYVNESAIRQLKEEWGCNVVRLAMYTGEYNGYCESGDAQKENLKNIIEIGVNAATKNDMYVMIDWHILSDGNPMKNKEEAKKFFAETSKKYAGNPHVIYEICNEPNGGGVTWDIVKEYALEILPIIRENDKDAIIIVGTPTWSQDVDIAAKDPITGFDNIMYALHFYAGTHKQGLRDKCSKALSMGLPVFVTEYGICDASGNGALDIEEADKWVDYMNRNEISYIAWNFSNKSEASAFIKASCQKKNGFTKDDLSAGGLWFLNMLQNTNGGMGAEASGSTDAGKTAEDEPSITPIPVVDYQKTADKYFSAGKGVTFTVTNAWDSGSKQSLQLNITVTNETDAKEVDWERSIKIKDGVKMEISQSWNAEMKLEGDYLKISPVEYNSVIAAGAEIKDIGLILEY